MITFPTLRLSLFKLEISTRQTRSHRLKVSLIHKMKGEEGSSRKPLSTTMGRTWRRNRERWDTQEGAERRTRKKTLMR